ncbi:YonK family protein [Cytobacillus gottheilii]|uniref:YonK family protein n=1 Tax=Cytobacillus gottheilii TaxID=859144 RepID=UPI0009B994A6|nr:YonK family protein [Cytobacillus gottheilii]
MAKDTLNRKYSNVVIDLEEMTLTEMPKKKDEEEREFDLMTELARFAGENRRVDITFNEVSEHFPEGDED